MFGGHLVGSVIPSKSNLPFPLGWYRSITYYLFLFFDFFKKVIEKEVGKGEIGNLVIR